MQGFVSAIVTVPREDPNAAISLFFVYTWGMIPNSKTVLLSLILMFAAGLVRADIVTLKDGTTHEGTVIKENRAEVVIETFVSNIKLTKTFPRYKVKSIEYKAYEVPEKEKKEEKPKVDREETEPDVEEADDRPSIEERRAAIKNRVLYMVIPVNGKIGVETNANGLRNALTMARRKKAKHIVFTIDSGGGFVYDAVESLKVLKEFDGDFEYHAVVDEGAISAASIYVAASDKIWVRPGSRVGGAVAYTSDSSSGAAEVDAKFNSIWAAEIASRAESKGHPPEIFRAMVEPGAEVWFDADGKVYPSRPSTSGAQQIDNATTILTIRADQMVEIGMATEFEGELSELGELLDIESWAEMRGVGERVMKQSGRERIALQEKYDNALKKFRDGFEAYEENDPTSFDDYKYERYNNGGYRPTSDSARLWRQRCDRAAANCNDMLAALADIATVNKRAPKIGALHLEVVPDDIGHDVYTTIRDAKEWLVENRLNAPMP